MRLKFVRVQDFRCVEDSTEFPIDDVTCLVGKNESGKTAILKALHKFNPQRGAPELFEPSRDYPKRKWLPGKPVPQDPAAVTTTWALTDDEMQQIRAEVGAGLRGPSVRITKCYDNKLRFIFDVDEGAVIAHLISSARLKAAEASKISGAKTVAQLAEALSTMGELTEKQAALKAQLASAFPDGLLNRLAKFIELPTFLYFDQYHRLPGQVAINDLFQRKGQKALKDSDQIFLALLSLTSTTIEELHSAPTFEDFNSRLRAVSNQITEMIFKYWSQNTHLDVEMRIDHARASDPPPYNSGFVFRTRIDNRRHRADTSFDDRSTGFVWFFSFLTWFYRLRDEQKGNLIVLLDEPGLTLHARAQADLLRYINTELRPSYQVIYTTHSPFMIDPDNLLSARTVEDVVEVEKPTGREVPRGTKVSKDVLSTDPDTISPLQKALDYEITQTLFVGRHTLLVEGPSDLLYLKWFSRQLERAGTPGLDYRWAISVVGGVDRIPGFVSLFRGNQLHVAAVIDVNPGDQGFRVRLERATAALAPKHLLTADAYAGQAAADIEDVIGRTFYLALVNVAFNLGPTDRLDDTASPTTPRVAEEVRDRFRVMPSYVRDFDHFVAAEHLFHSGDAGASLSDFQGALLRMGKLIADLNALIPK